MKNYIKWLLLITMFLLPLKSFSEEEDSLEGVLGKIQENQKAAAYNRLSALYLNKSILKAFDYAKQALILSRNLKDKQNEAEAELNLGMVQRLLMNYDDAYEAYKAGLSIYQSINDLTGVYKAYLNLGKLYQRLNSLDTSLKYFKLVKDNVPDERISADAEISIAGLLLIRGDFKQASSYIHHIVRHITPSNSELWIKYSIVSADYQKLTGNIDSAISLLKTASFMGLNSGKNLGFVSPLIELSDCYLRKNMPDSAMRISQEALDLAKKANNIEKISDCFYTLSKVYYYIHDYMNAFQMSNFYAAFKDSLTKVSFLKSIEQSESMENDLNLLRKDNDFQRKETTLLIVIILMTIAIAAGILNRLVFSRNKNKELTEAYNMLKVSEENLTKSNSEKTHYLDIINADIARASEYVMSVLPHPLKSEIMDITWEFVPSIQLGGDVFGYYHHGDCIVFYLIDVSGHGIGSALHAISVFSHIKNLAVSDTELLSPAKMLNHLHNNFPMHKFNDLFFTIWYGVYFPSEKKLRYASGGHHPAVLISSGTKPNYLVTKNPLIGLPRKVNFIENEFEIKPDSSLYLFSDGVFEVPKSNGKMQNFNEFAAYLVDAVSNDINDLDSFLKHTREMKQSDNLDDDFSILKINFK